MKPGGGLMIAVAAKPKASGAEDAEESSEGESSASEALFSARASALAKVLGVPADKQASFAEKLKAAIMACDY